MTIVTRAPAIQALLEGVVDYAGLFPPAALSLADAVREYRRHQDGPHAWMLGRFVVPAARLSELALAVAREAANGAEWRLTALVGNDLETDGTLIGEFNSRYSEGAAGVPRIQVDAVEFRAKSTEEIAAKVKAVPAAMEVYVEIPLGGELRPLLQSISRVGGRAKVRAGGVTPELFPSADALLGFLEACVELDVPFKATAGLHHPLRGEYRLTCEPDSPAAPMFGFLNLFLATAAIRVGLPHELVRALLTESSAAAFRFEPRSISYRGREISLEAIVATRTRSAIAFGSCSFDEPVDGLHALQVL